MPTSNPLPNFAILFLVAIVGLLIGSFIGAILLRAAAKIVNRMEIPFEKAYGTALHAGIIGAVISVPVGFILGRSGVDPTIVRMIAVGLIPVQIFATGSVISNNHNVSSGIGLKIAGVMFLTSAVITGVLLAVGISVIYLTSPY